MNLIKKHDKIKTKVLKYCRNSLEVQVQYCSNIEAERPLTLHLRVLYRPKLHVVLAREKNILPYHRGQYAHEVEDPASIEHCFREDLHAASAAH